MEKEILKIKNLTLMSTLLVLLISCKKTSTNEQSYEINKAIALVNSNESINDTLLKFRQDLGIKFIPCIITTTDEYRSLGFQILQSDSIKMPPLKIDRQFKILNIQGIDIIFISTRPDSIKHQIELDSKATELIKKGYITIDGQGTTMNTETVQFVFCKDDDNTFRILSTQMLYHEEIKANNSNVPFSIKNYYPKCGNSN